MNFIQELLLELDLKGAAKKAGLADIHAKQQQKKKDDFDAKYNTGMPVKIKLKVYHKKPAYTGDSPYEYREFTIDNLIAVRHKLDDVTLIDLATADDDKTKHADKATFAIMKTSKHLTGSLPEYLHDLPARTRKKPGFGPYDLRREAWTDSPIRTDESLTEMAKRTTPESFYAMAKKKYGAEKCKSVTMAEVVAVAKENDVQVPNYVVKQKIGRGRFNLVIGAEEKPAPKEEPKPAGLKWATGEKGTTSDEDLKKIVREIVGTLKQVSSVYQTDDIEINKFKEKSTAHGGVRDWGQWKIPDGEKDDGDYDWKVLTSTWKAKLNTISDSFEKKYPKMNIYISTEEKNWISVQVSDK